MKCTLSISKSKEARHALLIFILFLIFGNKKSIQRAYNKCRLCQRMPGLFYWVQSRCGGVYAESRLKMCLQSYLPVRPSPTTLRVLIKMRSATLKCVCSIITRTRTIEINNSNPIKRKRSHIPAIPELTIKTII